MSSDDDFFCNESQDSGNCSPMYSSDESFDDSPHKKQKKEDWQPKILTPQDCVPMMEAIIDDVKSVIDTPKTIIRVLMNLCKWDKQNLLEQFFSDNQGELFCNANLPKNLPKCVNDVVEKKLPNEECKICYIQTDDLVLHVSSECGDAFCLSCWTEYLSSKLLEQAQTQMISCPGCDVVIDDKAVLKLVQNKPKLKYRFEQILVNTFVDCNRLLKWCPFPNCNYIVKAPYADAKCVQCKCGQSYCFSCGKSQHDPICCRYLKKWLQKCQDDSETSNWLEANTKDCPKCQTAIEKNGGCNHMVCKKASCNHEFCWKCMKDWKKHTGGYSSCTSYNEKEENEKSGQGRSALNRYLFYFNHYNTHLNSMKFEDVLASTCQEKMDEMQKNQEMTYCEVTFLQKAVEVLAECRKTLMYSYAFAFYLSKNNQVEIFEENQKDLDHATEMLSEYLERDISRISDWCEIKQKVQDKTRYCDSRRQVLLDHVNEGYDNNWWVKTS